MNDLIDQNIELEQELDSPASSLEDVVYLPSEEMVAAINHRPENHLGVPNIHAPFPGVSPEMLDDNDLLEKYIDGFDKLKEWQEYHSFVLNHPEILENVKHKMRDYVHSKEFKHDLANVITLKEKGVTPIIVGGNMVERIIPLAYLYGLPVYQAPPVEGNWQELDTQLRELERNLDTLHHLADMTPNTLGFVWVGLDLSRESQRLSQHQDGDLVPVRFATKEIQMIQKMTKRAHNPVYFESMVSMPQAGADDKMIHGIAGFDFKARTKKEIETSPDQIIDLQKLQYALDTKLGKEDIAYLFSTGHWHHINTNQFDTQLQRILLESIKEALAFFRTGQENVSQELVSAAHRAHRKDRH